MSGVEATVRDKLKESYRIERRIGVGGMGEVFLGHDLKHQRNVAIKVVREDVVSPSTVDRFLREIRTVAQLTHPGILPVHDSGVADGLAYYVMPFVEDGSLRKLLDREVQLPVEQAIAIAADIGRALAYAHSHGVVHRDLKPENVLLQDGRPVITDFGLAVHLTGGKHNATEPGRAYGTPAYIAPEQAPGSAGIDGRADIYALGCMLFEMLAGEPPFAAATPQAIIARKMLGKVPGLATIRSSIPRDLERAIIRALAPVPADRFRDAGQFVRAIESKASYRRATVAVVSIVLIAFVIGGWLVQSRDTPLDPDTVVVDEFDNRTGNPALAAIGASVADWTTQGLHRTRLKSVVPIPAALQASRFVKQQSSRAGHLNPIAELAKETGAGIVISGAYYRTGRNLTFHAQLSEVSAGVWERLIRKPPRVRLRGTLNPVVVPADSVERAIGEIRERVMGALSLAAGTTDFAAPELMNTPPTFESYDRFTTAMAAYISNDNERAASGFLEVYQLDTTFVVALLYAALSLSNTQQYAREDSLLRIVARSSHRLTRYHRLWLEYRQALLSQDRRKALRAVRVLAAEAPRSKAMYNLGIEAWEDGHLQESVRALESLPPHTGPIRDFLPYWGALANVHHQLGDYREALAVARRAREAHPERLWPVAWELGAMAALGDVAEVVARTDDLANAATDDIGWSPAAVLREVAEELRAHGHAGAAKQMWVKALRAYAVNSRSTPLSVRDRFGSAGAFYALGLYAESRREYIGLQSLVPGDVRVVGQLGAIAAKTGDMVSARAVIDKLSSVDPRYQFGRPAFQAALVAAALGDERLSLEFLRRALSEGRAYGNWVHAEPDFERLRRTRAFQNLTTPRQLHAGR